QNTFRSPYTADKIKFEDNEAQGISKMIKKLAAKHIAPVYADYYLVNYITGECTCLDFIWHGSFHNFCKHGYAAHEYVSIKSNEKSVDQIKNELVQYFRNKERTISPNMKNRVIYNGTNEKAFAEILREHQKNGDNIFFSTVKQINKNDPYRPSELPKRKHTTVGLSKVNIETKNQIAIENEALNNHHDTYTEDISTITLNNSETNLDNSNKLSIIMEDCNDQDSMLMPSSSNNISESAFTSSIQPKSRN
ncbi:6408_t:CDS:2, partial [Cetraspora pellucida]